MPDNIIKLPTQPSGVGASGIGKILSAQSKIQPHPQAPAKGMDFSGFIFDAIDASAPDVVEILEPMMPEEEQENPAPPPKDAEPDIEIAHEKPVLRVEPGILKAPPPQGAFDVALQRDISAPSDKQPVIETVQNTHSGAAPLQKTMPVSTDGFISETTPKRNDDQGVATTKSRSTLAENIENPIRHALPEQDVKTAPLPADSHVKQNLTSPAELVLFSKADPSLPKGAPLEQKPSKPDFFAPPAQLKPQNPIEGTKGEEPPVKTGASERQIEKPSEPAFDGKAAIRHGSPIEMLMQHDAAQAALRRGDLGLTHRQTGSLPDSEMRQNSVEKHDGRSASVPATDAAVLIETKTATPQFSLPPQFQQPVDSAIGKEAGKLDLEQDIEIGHSLRAELNKPTQLTAPARAEGQMQLSHSIKEQVLNTVYAQINHEKVIKVALHPAELGRLKLSITPAEQGIVVTVISERPEIMDIMRKNIPDLEQAFATLGHDNMTFLFEQEHQSRNDPLPEHKDDVSPGPSAQDQPIEDLGPRPPLLTYRINGISGVDIRV